MNCKIEYTISIAAHNHRNHTQQCLKSIFDSGSDGDFEVIVLDNASEDDTIPMIESEFPEVKAIQNQKNMGFGAAHNQSLELAKGKFFVVLNNDIVVPKGWLEKLREPFLQEDRIGQSVPKGCCCVIGPGGYGTGNSATDKPEYAEGSCMMIPTHLARREGLFDTDLFRFAYCEDVDLSLRLRKQGYQIAVVDFHPDHKRATTAKDVKGIDLGGIRDRNHKILTEKWSRYLQTRTFKEKVLVRRDAARGDVLWTSALVRAMKNENVDYEIWVQSNCYDVLNGNPHIHSLRSDLGQEGFDKIIDLNMAYENNPRTSIWNAYLQKAGMSSRTCFPEIYLSNEEKEFAKKALSRAEGRPIAAFHCSHSWPGREWNIEKFNDVARNLIAKNWMVIELGDKNTPKMEISESEDFRGSLGLRHHMALVERSNLFVGIDSLFSTSAVAFRVPSVVLFGMIDPAYRIPEKRLAFPVTSDAGCLGCHHYLLPPRTSGRCYREPKASLAECMRRIEVGNVLDAIEEVLKMYPSETAKIRDRISHLLHGKIVDLGCGPDKVSPEAVGVDKFSMKGVDHVLDISESLPFRDDEFDVVYSSHALEDIRFWEKALQEWVRILKPGGILILYVPDKELYTGVNLDHCREYEMGQIPPVLEKIGCVEIDETRDEGEDRYSILVTAKKGE